MEKRRSVVSRDIVNRRMPVASIAKAIATNAGGCLGIPCGVKESVGFSKKVISIVRSATGKVSKSLGGKLTIGNENILMLFNPAISRYSIRTAKLNGPP